MKFTYLIFFTFLFSYSPLLAQIDTPPIQVKGQVIEEIEEEEKKPVEEIFKIVEEMPRFPGCEDMEGTSHEKKGCSYEKLADFIQDSIQYPQIALESGIKGRCFVTFVIETDGTISGIKLLRDIGGTCGVEALRVVGLMQKHNITWIPGKQRGRNVRVQFNMPVHFKLPSGDD